MPFDLYCPSMREKLEEGICKTCWLYWPSKAAIKRHEKAHKLGPVKEKIDTSEVIYEFDSDEEPMEIEQEHPGPMPVFDNIQNYLTSPFVYLTDEIEEEH